MRNRSLAKRRCILGARQSAKRHFRPAVEPLESRRLLAADPLLFIENFSDDYNPSLRGLDSADDDPNTPPDRLLIQHHISARGWSIDSNGFVRPDSTFVPSPPFSLSILGPGTDRIQLPPTGTPGGLAVGEEVTAVAIGYSGLGSIRFFGNNGIKTFAVNEQPFTWHSITVTANSPSDTGQELGAIHTVDVSTIEFIQIDDIALLINGIISNNPPVANPDSASTLPGVPVDIDALANDGDVDGDRVLLHHFQPPPPPAQGTIAFNDGLFTFTPAPGFHGIATFDYYITDGRIPQGSEVKGTVSILVNTPPPTPVVRISVPHGSTGPFTFDEAQLLAGIADADGDPLSVASFDSPQLGTSLTRNPDGTFTYVPRDPAGLVQDDQFQFRLGDGFVVGEKGVAIIDVDNAPPVAVDDVEPLPHGFFGDFNVTAPGVRLNDLPDPEGDAVRAVLYENASHGVVTLNPNGSYTYSPFDGGPIIPDSFKYRLFDGVDYSNIATLRIDVPNQSPIAHNDFVRAQPRPDPVTPSPTTFDVRTNDSDPEGDTLAGVIIVDRPVHGSVAVNPNGTLTYEPGAFRSGFPGLDTFSYRVSDRIGESNLAWVTVDVSTGGPATYLDVYALPPGFSLYVDAEHGLLANDYSPTGQPLEIASFIGQSVTFDTQYGTVTQYPDGSFQYVSNIDFEAVDGFTYRATDGTHDTPIENVVIYVVNDSPELFPDHYQTPPDSLLQVPAPGIFANDQGPSIGISNFSTTGHGTLSVDLGDGSFSYRPAPGFIGVDSFLYSVSNGQGAESNPGRVTIQVGQPPLAADDRIRVPSGGKSNLNVLINDSDPNGRPISAIRLDGPHTGPPDARLQLLQPNGSKQILTTASLAGDVPFTGSFDYLAPTDFAGLDTFTYVATDGAFRSEPATVTIQVNAPPVAVDDAVSLLPNSAGFVGTLLDNDSDADGDTFFARLVTPPSHIILDSFDSFGGLSYIVPAGFGGTDTLTYEIYDLWDSSRHTAMVTINVASPDADQDGIGDDIEDAAPHGGDGNNDGTPDRQQNNVASLPNAADGRYVTFAGPAGTSFVNVQAVLPANPLPPGFSSVIGFFSFELSGLAPGGSASVTATLPTGVNPTTYLKFGPTPTDATPHWYPFSFDGTTGAEISGNVVTLHFVDGRRGDDDLGANGVIVEPGGPAAGVFPHIASVVINDGAAQRSKIDSVLVTFDSVVTLDPGALELRQQGNNKLLSMDVAVSTQNGRTLARLTFHGHHVVGGSLPDGQYRLTIRGDKIRNNVGRRLDGDGNGSEGGNHVDAFFRLFGDSDGDGDVDLLDKRVFDKAFGKRSNQAGYLWYLDYNANGRIWAEDLALFLLNFGRCKARR